MFAVLDVWLGWFASADCGLKLVGLVCLGLVLICCVVYGVACGWFGFGLPGSDWFGGFCVLGFVWLLGSLVNSVG